MVATLLSAAVGAAVAVVLALAGVAALQPDVKPGVSQSQMVRYGDNGHL